MHGNASANHQKDHAKKLNNLSEYMQCLIEEKANFHPEQVHDHKNGDVGETGRGKSPHNMRPRRGKTVRCCCRYRARRRAASQRTRETPGKPETWEKVASADIAAAAIFGAQTNGWLWP